MERGNYGGSGGSLNANPPPAQAWGNRGPGNGGQGGAYRPPPSDQSGAVGPRRFDSGESSAWGDARRSVAIVTGVGVPNQPQRTAEPVSPIDPVIPEIQSLTVSEDLHQASLVQSIMGNRLPAKRPDKGGKNGIRSINLLVNHFPVKFNFESTIFHYDVEIKPEQEKSFKGRPRNITKSNLQMIKDKLFSDNPTRFPVSKTAYDGEKNIFSAIELPTGKFKVELIDEDKKKSGSYIVSLTHVNELKLSKLKDYLSENLVSIPRDILQGMDVVMKENPSRNNFSVGRSFYPRRWDASCELGGGNIALRGFQQSLKLTSQDLVLCLDYSALAFRKPLPVLDYLMECIDGFDVNGWRSWRYVEDVLRGLQVMVTHRRTKQKFTLAKLTERNTRDISFPLEDPERKLPPTEEISLIKYFKDRYDKDITYAGIPCLDLGKNNRTNYMPMEFCVMVEGQRYPNELLDRDAAMKLKGVSLPMPNDRRGRICGMIRAEDGPCGRDVTRNFDIQVAQNMTQVAGRVIGPPELKVRAPNGKVTKIRVDNNRCQWNLVGKSLMDGKPVGRWALLDFSSADRRRLNPDRFIFNLRNRCRSLGILMEDPVVKRFTRMSELLDFNGLRKLLDSVIKEANGPLQMIVCLMTEMEPPGYKYLKYISEIEIGVVTQCCLSTSANKGFDQYFANLALKINAKLGGSNVELIERLPRFEGRGSVMFVGADVNHPGSKNSTCPSMAAVVATMNWPAANRYAARVCPQIHRKEKILKFGDMCLDLVNTYEKINNAKPDNIVVFRDGVSESQFDMVLSEELVGMINKVCQGTYQPKISLIVAQKRHETRLFPQNPRDVDSKGNVPPGTVVDTKIVHPFIFDFYLCSHYGGLGTSKPTHYYVLWNEHNFNSDQIQKLIYHMCFTFARCTKPVSLVPPVYYADLVAYRGRMFQEVVMSLPHSELASSSTSSVASASSSTSYDASFDEKFYMVHPKLKNTMFFV